MRKIFKTTFFIVAFGIALISCNNEEISSDGIISGSITYFTEGSIDSIYYKNWSPYLTIYGKSSVSSNGKFSMTLATPSLKVIDVDSEIVVSDPTALVSNMSDYGFMSAYKDKEYIGRIVKCNIDYNPSTIKAGELQISLIYSNKPCIIKGTDSQTFSWGGNHNIMLKFMI